MKRNIIECDVCHKEITNARERYIFKRHKRCFGFYPVKIEQKELDMCADCFTKLQDFCKGEYYNG